MFFPSATARQLAIVSLILGALPLARLPADEEKPPESSAEAPRTRTFQFTYSATVTGLQPGQAARIWVPVPPSNEDQEVKIVSRDLPGKEQLTREPEYGNRVLYLEAKADEKGESPLTITYQVLRREVKADPAKNAKETEQIARFLKPDAHVPIDGKPLELIEGKQVPKDQVAAARMLYDIVDDHMRYSKEGTGWGRGDSAWACESGRGNCTDFHSLFISLVRSRKIPAKFEIGFPLPAKRGSGEVPGYHCWAKFRPAGKGWIPVDISEANKNPKLRDYYFGNLTEDRVAFSTGRDIDLEPRQDGGPLNFFIYPYVEVNGQPYPADKVKRQFSFKDVEAEGEK